LPEEIDPAKKSSKIHKETKKWQKNFSISYENFRAHLVVAMGGRAAEAVFFGEDKVCTGAISDMQQALQIARKIGTRKTIAQDIKFI